MTDVKFKLLPKLMLSLGLLGLALTLSLSFFGYYNSKEYLEDMYAYRVVFGAKSIATMLDVDDVRTIVSEGGDQSEAYVRVREKLNRVKLEGGMNFLSLVTLDEDSVTFYIDCNVPEMRDDPADEMPYGTDVLYTDAAGSEEDLQRYLNAWACYSNGVPVDPPTVTYNSYGYNYSSAAPILDENGQAIAEIQYILDMNDVHTHLQSFLNTMLGIAAVIVSVAVALYHYISDDHPDRGEGAHQRGAGRGHPYPVLHASLHLPGFPGAQRV